MTSSQPNTRWTHTWRISSHRFSSSRSHHASRSAHNFADANTGAPREREREHECEGGVPRRLRRRQARHVEMERGLVGVGSNPSHPVDGKEDDCYDPGQVLEKGGYLILVAIPHNCLGYKYMSGLVNTNGRFQFTTGVLKVSACGSHRGADQPSTGPTGPTVSTGRTTARSTCSKDSAVTTAGTCTP